jgi:hypothetical protein
MGKTRRNILIGDSINRLRKGEIIDLLPPFFVQRLGSTLEESVQVSNLHPFRPLQPPTSKHPNRLRSLQGISRFNCSKGLLVFVRILCSPGKGVPIYRVGMDTEVAGNRVGISSKPFARSVLKFLY